MLRENRGRRVEWLSRRYRTDFLGLSLALVALTFFVAPTAGYVFRQFGVPYPQLSALALAGGIYGLTLAISGEYTYGLLAAVIITPTLHANVPLPGIESSGYPGTIVANITLYQLLTVALAVLYVRQGRLKRLPRPLELLVGFGVLAGLGIVLGTGPRPLGPLFFGVYVLLTAVSAGLIYVSIPDLVSAREALVSFGMGVGGHVAFASVQFLNQSTFGMTRLGEGGDLTAGYLSLPLVGQIRLGAYISGLSGMGFDFANLLVLLIPVLCAVFVYRPENKLLTAIPILWAAFLLRAVGSDAARGAMLLALVAFGCFYAAAVVRKRITEDSLIRGRRTVGRVVVVVVLLSAVAAVTLVPSTESGAVSEPIESGSESSQAAPGGDGSSLEQAKQTKDAVAELSVPLFDLQNLGVRLHQYVAAIQTTVAHPLFGVGALNFVFVADQYGVPISPVTGMPYAVHSIYLTLLAETGVTGFLVYVSALIVLFRKGISCLTEDSSLPAIVVAGVLAGMIGSLGFGFWDILQLYNATGFVSFWMLGAILLASAERVSEPQSGHHFSPDTIREALHDERGATNDD